ncbi:MAG: hypothetical protein ACI85O_003077 [Saprospiraceae bacterium]|jgi:hypothetical protein
MILMGGSPSTGSSLLVNILNRHPEIFAGSETYLFLHKDLAENWNSYKNKLLNTGKIRGLKSPAWFRFNGVLLENKDYDWMRVELQSLIENSSTYEIFVNAFFARPLSRNNKSIWIEKSPANSFNFKYFAERNPETKVIQVIRNPYDTAASLFKRGNDAWFSAGRCLFANARALSAAHLPNYYCISYEKLVENPEQEISKLLKFLNLSTDVNLLEPTAAERAKKVQMPGWQHNEHGKIGKSSVGRFQKLQTEEQALLRAAFSSFQLNENYTLNPNLRTAEQIFAALEYDYFPEKVKPFKEVLHEARAKDMWARTWRLYPTGLGNYLASITI